MGNIDGVEVLLKAHAHLREVVAAVPESRRTASRSARTGPARTRSARPTPCTATR
jgi:hypothetical protein